MVALFLTVSAVWMALALVVEQSIRLRNLIRRRMSRRQSALHVPHNETTVDALRRRGGV